MQLPKLSFITSLFTAPQPSAEEKQLASAHTPEERAHMYQRLHAHEELPFLVKAASWLITGQVAARAANPADATERRIIDDTVDICKKLNIAHVPGVFIIDSPIPNAASVDGSHMIITRGLIEAMPPEQLKAVVGHEMAHHRHAGRDRFGTWRSILIGASFGALSFVSLLKPSASFPTLALGGGILSAYTVGSFARSMHSRSMEYESDLEGALVTSPETMRDALQSLEAKVEELKEQEKQKRENGEGAGIGKKVLRKVANFIRSPFPTHPSTDKRVARLEELAKQPALQEKLLTDINSEHAKELDNTSPNSQVSEMVNAARVSHISQREVG